MKVIDAYPKDVHVQIDIPLKELKMLKSFIEKSMPIYAKVMEEYEEESFLEHNFLPEAKSVIEYAEKFSK
jgi:hypothetical protein